MAIADFNVGRDVQVVLMLGALGRLDLEKVTSFSCRQITKDVIIMPLNEPAIGRYIPGHWEGEIDLDRANSAADDATATIEAAYWNGQRLPTGTMYQYVSETDGSLSTYQFDGVSVAMTDAGTATQEAPIKVKLKFFARTRKRV